MQTLTAAPTPTTVVTTASDGVVHTMTSTVASLSEVTQVSGATAGGEKKSSGVNTGLVVGVVVGVLVLIALLAIALWAGIRHGRKKAEAAALAAGGAPPPVYPDVTPVYPAAATPVYPAVASHNYVDTTGGAVEKDGHGSAAKYEMRGEARELGGNEVLRS